MTESTASRGQSSRVVGRLLGARGTGAVLIALVCLMVWGTGGASSPFQDVYVLVLTFDGALRSRVRLWMDLVLVVPAALAPAVYDDVPAAFVGDAVVDIAVWVGVAVLVRTLMGRLRAGADRQRALAQAARRSAAVVESTDVAVVSTDLHGVIQTWNPAAERLFGWSADEAVGRPSADLIPDDVADEALEILQGLRAGRSSTVETTRLHRDGTPIDVLLTFSPVRDEDGTIVGTSGVLRDLRERRQWERAVERRDSRLRRVAELSHGIVYRLALAPEPHLEELGSATERITGFAPDDFLDPGFAASRVHPDDRAAVSRGRFTDGVRGGNLRYRFRTADERWIWLEDHFSPELDDDGNLVAIVGIVFDVSAREEAERARERALRDQSEAAATLAETVRAQRAFVQSLSHEVRTPLSAVNGFVSTLRDHHRALGEDQVDALLERARVNAQRLGSLLTDLLEVHTSLDEGAASSRLRLDLSEVVGSCLKRADLGERPVELVTTLDAEVLGDPQQLRRLVEALVDNVRRHTPADTPTRVVVERRDALVELRVEDDGPGIPPEEQASMFSSFRQGAGASDAASPGMGIGLAIVDRFARSHDGTVHYETGPHGGSRFVVRLPAAPD